jgi:hypothetical protein
VKRTAAAVDPVSGCEWDLDRKGIEVPPTRLEPDLPRWQVRREDLARTRMEAAGKESGGRPTRHLAVGEQRGRSWTTKGGSERIWG